VVVYEKHAGQRRNSYVSAVNRTYVQSHNTLTISSWQKMQSKSNRVFFAGGAGAPSGTSIWRSYLQQTNMKKH